MPLKKLIHKINDSPGIKELFGTTNWKKGYRAAIMLLHPDKTDHPAAAAALLRLNRMRTTFEKGQLLKDDAGEMQVYNWGARFNGNIHLLQHSEEAYRKLKSLNSTAATHFHHLLPESMAINGNLETKWLRSAFSLSGRRFPQRHVQWILSRLLEFAAWLAQEGYVHAGLHPESIWIVPETHGIIIGSFYHMTRRGARLKTVSAHYQNWYPASVFTNKKATSQIDIELIKRTAIYLLGDPSGGGIKLQKIVSPALMDFLLAEHSDVFHCYDDYRRLLKRNFKDEFHKMIL